MQVNSGTKNVARYNTPKSVSMYLHHISICIAALIKAGLRSYRIVDFCFILLVKTWPQGCYDLVICVRAAQGPAWMGSVSSASAVYITLIPTGVLLCQMVQKLVNKYHKFSYLCHVFWESEWRHSARMLQVRLGSVAAPVLCWLLEFASGIII